MAGKQGHDGLIGINCLEKSQMSTPAILYGAMLAGVDVVLMGAGIPREIPHLLDDLAAHHRGELSVDVLGAPAGGQMKLDRPGDGTATAQKLNEQTFMNGENTNFGAMFANKITVDCP